MTHHLNTRLAMTEKDGESRAVLSQQMVLICFWQLKAKKNSLYGWKNLAKGCSDPKDLSPFWSGAKPGTGFGSKNLIVRVSLPLDEYKIFFRRGDGAE